jgi:hypothetical protein
MSCDMAIGPSPPVKTACETLENGLLDPSYKRLTGLGLGCYWQ